MKKKFKEYPVKLTRKEFGLIMGVCERYSNIDDFWSIRSKLKKALSKRKKKVA